MSTRRWLLLSTIPAAAAAGIGAWVLRTFDPNLPGNPFPACLFHQLTGFYCLGCGTTRALHALVHGDIATALRMNALVLALMALLPFTVAWQGGWRPALLQPIARWLGTPWPWAVGLPAYWIARNLPWFPFTLLAPG